MLAIEGSYSSSPELHRDHSRFFLAIGYLGVAGILLAGRSCVGGRSACARCRVDHDVSGVL